MLSALAALALGQAALPAACPHDLCDAERLRPYFDKLAEAKRGRRTVRVIQIGDSHTAGDQITGAWRSGLQARYGSGGRGVLAPGKPYAGYLTRGITAAQSSGWTIDGIFGAAWRGENGAARGLANFSLSSSTPAAWMTLTADPGEEFDRFTVCARRAPGAGFLTLSAGGASAPMPLAGDAPGPICQTLRADALTNSAGIIVEAGPVTITSWSTERADMGGVIVSNVGTVGVQLTHLARTDDATLQAELKQYRPDLLVVAYGTNEAFAPGFSAAGYEATLREQIARLRRFIGGAPILLLGAPDSGTKRSELRGGQTACDGSLAPAPAPGIGPTDMVEPLPASSAGQGGGWGPTATLATVQLIQRRIAHELGLAFWDWSAAMGGRCTASRWTALDPPLMRGDHVHFTSAGGREIARRLEDDLDAAARRLRGGRDEPGKPD